MTPGHSPGTDAAGGSLEAACQAPREILARVGDKWSMLIVMLLVEKPMRFSEIRRTVGGISQRMLTLTLRHLERDGLVRRTVVPSTPPRVDYVLTALGRSLSGPVAALGGWARANRAQIEAARAVYDRQAPPVGGQAPQRVVPARL